MKSRSFFLIFLYLLLSFQAFCIAYMKEPKEAIIARATISLYLATGIALIEIRNGNNESRP